LLLEISAHACYQQGKLKDMSLRTAKVVSGLAICLTLNASAGVLYVNLNSVTPVAPYAAWNTAATNIQDAIDAANPGDQILVTNGVYLAGGRVVYGALTNRVAITKPVVVQSVNGPAVTSLQGNPTIGDSAVRCVYLTNNAVLAGFTLTGGATRNAGDFFKERTGGGAWCESTSSVLSNCVVAGNTAYSPGGGVYQGMLRQCTITGNTASQGGGVYQAALDHCTLSNNSAATFAAEGGAAWGGTLTNCLIASNSASAGGGAQGASLYNCVLSNNFATSGGGGAIASTLSNCTLVNNKTPVGSGVGGGAWGGTLDRCLILGNSAPTGGGVFQSTLKNCVVLSNSASIGGGAYRSTIVNCTLTANSANTGGGAYEGGLNNSIAVNNSAVNNDGPNYTPASSLSFCCTSPLPVGPGNITNTPLFINFAGGNLRLLSNSPCINAGLNSAAPTSPDLDGNPRIDGGTVDMGAFEFPGPASTLSYAWSQQFGFPTDGSADYADPDTDGMNNWQEWRAGTNPTNAASLLRLSNPVRTNADIVITWQSVTNRVYYLEVSGGFAATPFFQPLANNIPGQAGTTSYTDVNAAGLSPRIYRIRVQ
jgi:parallel beta-helix repeat protein